jgi:hypothetical protein
MDPLDEVLCRAWNLAKEDSSDEVDEELERLLPPLVEAGYVSATEYLWRFTDTGVKRVEALGCD